MEKTLNVIADLSPNKFDVIVHSFPKYLGKDKNRFREVRELQSGYFIEVNLSAELIRKICYQAMEMIELSSEEWEVDVK
jgi:hypothetical protein